MTSHSHTIILNNASKGLCTACSADLDFVELASSSRRRQRYVHVPKAGSCLIGHRNKACLQWKSYHVYDLTCLCARLLVEAQVGSFPPVNVESPLSSAIYSGVSRTDSVVYDSWFEASSLSARLSSDSAFSYRTVNCDAQSTGYTSEEPETTPSQQFPSVSTNLQKTSDINYEGNSIFEVSGTPGNEALYRRAHPSSSDAIKGQGVKRLKPL
jgi:hypothetical protein